jgi:CBS domain-containing protein
MAMLSELFTFDVVDAAGEKAKLFDLGLSLLEDDYPPVDGIYFDRENGLKRLPWSDVEQFDKAGKRINVSDLKKAGPASEEEPVAEVLLRRDVLDALIVDLIGRRTTRASDLHLAHEDGLLRLRAVDAGLAAMLRRITRGTYRGLRKRDMYDWKYVEFLRGDPQAVDSGAGYQMRIGHLSGGEISQIAEYLPYLHAAELITLLADEKAAEALQAMSIERQIQIIDEFDEDQAVSLLTLMSPDRATDLIGSLGIETTKRYLGKMPERQRERIIRLLQYPGDSVGGMMINNIVEFGAGTRAGTAREKLKKHASNRDFISVMFITKSNKDATLLGTASIRALLEAEDDKKLKDIMNPYSATLKPYDNAREASFKVIGSQVEAMPVTETDGQLVGAMTIDAAISQTVPGAGLHSLKIFS